MLEINLLFGPKLHLMWREVDIYLTFLNSADALQLLKLSTILKHKIQFNQGPTERWEIFLVFFPNPGIVFYVVIDEGRLAKLRCVAESVTWQSQSRGHRSNPAQIVCKSKQLDPKHLREALADSRPDQDKAAALLCPSSLPPAISCCCINIIISPFPQSGADLLRSEREREREEVDSTSHAMAIANPLGRVATFSIQFQQTKL